MFVIVKNASPECKNRWVGDPASGVHLSFSCHNTVTGRHVGVKPSYQDKDEAEIDCQRANHSNPCGYYAVCPVLNEKEMTVPTGSIETIEDTAENWENGKLGRDAAFARVVPESELQDINKALDLEIIGLRLEKELVETYKARATIEGVGYRTLMRRAIKAFIATTPSEIEGS
jgi:predicted DNA binding CopG/RHH family protein